MFSADFMSKRVKFEWRLTLTGRLPSGSELVVLHRIPEVLSCPALSLSISDHPTIARDRFPFFTTVIFPFSHCKSLLVFLIIDF